MGKNLIGYNKLGVKISEKNVAFAFDKFLDIINRNIFDEVIKEYNLDIDTIKKDLESKHYENISESVQLGFDEGEDLDINLFVDNSINCVEFTRRERIKEIIKTNETNKMLLFTIANIDTSNMLYAIWSNEFNQLLGVGILHYSELKSEPEYRTYFFWQKKDK